MAHIDVDKRIIKNVNNDDIIAVLNQMIDDELSKSVEDIDTIFVDECVDALLRCEQEENNFAVLIPLVRSEKFLRNITREANPYSFKRLNVFARTAIVAALIAGGTITANASVEAITGVNVIQDVAEKIGDKLVELGWINSTNPTSITSDIDYDNNNPEPDYEKVTETTAQSTTEKTTQKTSDGVENLTVGINNNHKNETTTKEKVTGIENIDVGFDDEEEPETQPTTQKPKPTNKPVAPTTAPPIIQPPTESEKVATLIGVDAEFNDFKTDYIYGEALSYDGLVMTAVYSNGNRVPLSLSECDYTKAVDMNKTADYTLRIIYKTCEVTVDITVRPDEDTRGSQICSDDEFDYLLTDKGAYLTAYKGSDTVLELDEIDGNEVVAIGSKVFENSNVERVYAQNVTKIFAYAFANCSELSECYVPEAVYIGDYAFTDCTRLSEAIFSDNADYLGNGAYRRTAIEVLNVPENISEISAELCRECSELTAVSFRGKVTAVGDSAFEECEKLEKATGCENIERVGDFAFYYDDKLDFDTFPQVLRNVGDSSFYFCQKLTIGYLPSSVEKVSSNSFAYCLGLTGVTIPDGMKVVPKGAFMATNAKTIVIPEGVTEVKESAFEACKATTVELPNTLKIIGDKAFYTILLRNVYFGYKVQKIGTDAFYPSRSALFRVYDDSVPMQYCIDNKIRYVSLGEIPKHSAFAAFDGIESLDGGWD